MTEECVCGFEAKDSRGLSAHQRYCDEYVDATEDESDDEDTESVADAASVSTADAEAVEAEEFTGVEAEVVERDGYECVRCEALSDLTVHRYQEGSEALANLVTLCEDCDEALTGLHHRTKRGEVNR